jgi:hypothetical protein
MCGGFSAPASSATPSTEHRAILSRFSSNELDIAAQAAVELREMVRPAIAAWVRGAATPSTTRGASPERDLRRELHPNETPAQRNWTVSFDPAKLGHRVWAAGAGRRSGRGITAVRRSTFRTDLRQRDLPYLVLRPHQKPSSAAVRDVRVRNRAKAGDIARVRSRPRRSADPFRQRLSTRRRKSLMRNT